MDSIRTLVVDDSIIMRKMLSLLLSREDNIEVVGLAKDGKEAVRLVRRLNPDLIIMDVIMPGMGGIEALAAIREFDPTVPIIMFSSATRAGATVTVDALARGATDYVAKPQQLRDAVDSMETIRSVLVPKINLHGRPRKRVSPFTQSAQDRAVRLFPPGFGARIVAVGVSTGGPDALGQFLSFLPAQLSVPILVVQHMPAQFTGHLAERLNQKSRINVVLAQEGVPLAKGTVYICPGNKHLVVVGSSETPRIRLTEGPPVNSCRPSVDVLLQSVARVYGERSISVILTGMGNDGLLGARELYELGGLILVQDEQSSVVWGMPGAVARAGLSHSQGTPTHLAKEVLKTLQGR